MSQYITTSDPTPSLLDDALMAILPTHAKRIYDGSKTFELRKAIPRLIPRRMFLYETGEVRAVTGHIVIDEVISGPPDQVWRLTQTRATTRKRFDEYFNGRNAAHAYRIADAVHYSEPLPLSKLLAIDPGFRVPQQFLYLQNLPSLQKHLRAFCTNQCLALPGPHIRLTDIDNSQRSDFVQSVRRHISEGYSETGEAYAKKILSISDAGDDPEGFLTTAKCVRTIEFKRRKVGFVVLTFKLTGCVKTGPVILAEAHRRRGVGTMLRQQLHEAVRSMGYRKVFATVPADNVPAQQYLLASGYRIEAHMCRAYHPQHDEVVLGYLLDHKRGPGPEFVRQITPATTFERVSEPLPEISAFFHTEFSSEYCKVPDGWATRQLRMACDNRTEMFKPRLAFTASQGSLLAATICLLKRGGSAKLVLVSKTGHRRSLASFLDFVERQVAKSKQGPVLRTYTQVPVNDSDVIQAFLDLGYRPEGVVEQAFSRNSDTLVLAKQLE
jgi:predicted transcriptional regulator/GNAT superfamily N-acetyltransferase